MVNNIKCILSVLFVLFLSSLSVMASSWIKVEDKIYVDAESIEQVHYRSDWYSLWIKHLNDGSKYYKDIEKKYGKKIWYDLSLFLFDCRDKTYTVKSTVLYDTAGGFIDSYDGNGYPDSVVVPDTMGEFYHNIACRIYATTTTTTIPNRNSNINSAERFNKKPSFKIKYRK